MYSKKKMWSDLHLLVDTAVMVCDNEERFARKEKSKIIYVEDDDDESAKKLFTRRSYPQQHFRNLTVSSSIMKFGYLKSPFVESEKLKTRDPPNPNGSSSIMNLGYLKSPLVESEKTKTKDSPNPNDDKSSSPSDPPNPNDDKSSSPSSCLTENTSRKRRAQKQKQRKSKGGFNFKRAKISPLQFVDRKIPNWVFQVMRNINGDVENPRMLFERTLTESDVKSSQSRLLIPFSMLITEDFLTPEEARAMNKKENKQEDENVGVGTIVVNERCQMWGLRLKIWQMEKKNSGKGTLNYALNWGWNDVVEGNHLKANDKIGLWVFRCRGVLCFALDLLEHVNSIISSSSTS